MIKYKTTGIVNITHGHVALDEDQARRRKINIEEVEVGVYKVINPIQFKSGESFSSDIELNKALADVLSIVKQPQAKTKKKAKK